MQDVIIVGASGFGREVLAMLKRINNLSPTWNVKGFIDDNPNALNGYKTDYSVIGNIKDWQPTLNEQYVLAIANPRIKENVISTLKERNAYFATIIDPNAGLPEHGRYSLGEGVILFPGVGISVDVTIGNFVFLNASTVIGHDCIIGDYCTLAPNVYISGKTILGKGVSIGVSACTRPGITIGDYATVGLGSAVIRNVKPETTVIGVPAKKI